MHVMFIPSWYSSMKNPVHGSFFKEQALALQEEGVKISIAYNEIWPITVLGKVKEQRGLSFQIEDDLRTYRYKDYNFLPKNPLMFKVFNKRMEKLYKEIVRKEGKVDLIHGQSSLWGGISAAYISEKYNIPLVITEHSSVERGPYVKESYKNIIRDSYLKADSLIVVGNGLKKEIQSFTGRDDIKVIHNLISMDMFTIEEKNNSKDEFIFFSLAFLEGEKGMDILIKAFAKVFKNKNVKLKIGGGGSQRQMLENISKDLKVEKQVEFLGPLSRDEVKIEMQGCDSFVLASKHETFGVVYIEALSAGKPVIGTYNGGAEDIINKNNGILVPTNNLDELSKAMEKMQLDIKKYNNIKISEACKDCYGKKKIATDIIREYEQLIR